MGRFIEDAHRHLGIIARAAVGELAVAEWIEQRLAEAGINAADAPIGITGPYSRGAHADVTVYLPAQREGETGALALLYRTALGMLGTQAARTFNQSTGKFEWTMDRRPDETLAVPVRITIVGTPERDCEIERIEETVKTVRYKAKCKDLSETAGA